MGTTQKEKLTAPRIAKATCPAGMAQCFIWDTALQGLALRVSAQGRKTFIYQSRLAGKSLRLTIGLAGTYAGTTGTYTIDEARKEATRLQAEINSGHDPRIIKANKTASDVAKRERAKADNKPAIELWPDYMEARKTRQKKPWSDTTYKAHKQLASKGGEPKTRGKRKGEGTVTQKGTLYDLLQLPIVKIDAEVIENWLKQNAYRPASAEFGYVRLRAFMNWCNRQKAYKGRINIAAFDDDNVKEQVPIIDPGTGRLDTDELKPWFDAVINLPNPFHAAYLQITLLTGCRRNELAPLRWENVDFETNTMRLSGKTGTREIPIPPYVRHLLEDLNKRNKDVSNIIHIDGTRPQGQVSPFVFPSQTSKSGHIEEPRYAHDRALKAAGLKHRSIHDLRRTFGSMSVVRGADMPEAVTRKIQGHAPQEMVGRTYRVYEGKDLATHHAPYEKWILEQAGIEQPAPLRVVGGLKHGR